MAARPVSEASARHLLSRFAFGPRPADIAWVCANGTAAWWDAQVAAGLSHGRYSAHPAIAATGPLLDRSPAEVRAWLKANGNEYGWTAMDQLTRVTLGLQAWSPAQLYETVVDFFANHLNVANHHGDLWDTRHTMDRDVVRAHAFGTYTDMLLASARNPAMLRYLDLADSRRSQLNENYGRELLELHTVGLGYSEADVQNSARILTGRTLDRDHAYVYDADQHWVGPITVLGFTHPNNTAAGGEAAGDAYLRYLARHPATASRLARKLCVRFVSDTPPDALVARVAQAYLTAGTAIVPTVRAIFTAPEFWAGAAAKLRRPTENLLATIRLLDVHPAADLAETLKTLHWMSGSVGHVPLDWAPPNGYPDVATSWRSSSTLLTLWEYHRGLVQNWWPKAFSTVTATDLYAPARPGTSGAAITALAQHLLGAPLPGAHAAALQAFLGEPAGTPLGSSQLRWYLGHLVPLILDSPHFAVR